MQPATLNGIERFVHELLLTKPKEIISLFDNFERTSIMHLDLHHHRYIKTDNNIQSNAIDTRSTLLSTVVYNLSTPGVSCTFKLPSNIASTKFTKRANNFVDNQHDKLFFTFNDVSGSIIDLGDSANISQLHLKYVPYNYYNIW